MKFRDQFKIGWRNLVRRKGRTFLTALGVSIGTTAVVGMVSLGIGLKAAAVESLESFQDLTVLEVNPSYDWEAGEEWGEKKIKKVDIENLKKIPGVIGVSPTKSVWGIEVSMGRKFGRIDLKGIDPEELNKFKYKMEEGVLFPGEYTNEAVITYSVPVYMQEDMKPSRNFANQEGEEYNFKTTEYRLPMVGEEIVLSVSKDLGDHKKIQKEYSFHVVGMMAEGQGGYGAKIYIPLQVAEDIALWNGEERQQLPKSRYDDQSSYDSVLVKANSREDVETIVEGIRQNNLETWSAGESLKELNKFFLVVQLILGGVGTISLLVASIGIMNTMIMSILERTKEIGVMKVVGATLPMIRRMFLVEAGMIGMIGGIWGLTGGYFLAVIANLLAKSFGSSMGGQIDKIAIIPWWLAFFAVMFSFFIGVISGWYPAHRASKISPLQAIREE